jgi:hypothetical protein
VVKTWSSQSPGDATEGVPYSVTVFTQ